MSKPVDLTAFHIKTTVISAIREYLNQASFQEVITPVMSRGVPVEPNLYPFTTTWSPGESAQELYLAMSPENGLKKLLALGLGDCYAIGKTFRNLENSGSNHRPEFLMLEWYRWDTDYTQIMRDVTALVRSVKKAVDVQLGRPVSLMLEYQGQVLDLSRDWPVLSIDELCQAQFGMGLDQLTQDEVLIKFAAQKGYQTDQATWHEVFDQLFLNELEPLIPNRPCFLIDFPTRTSPLCQPRADKPYLVERFEVFVNQLELGNGNTEHIQAEVVRQNFVTEQAHRRALGQPVPQLDEQFIAALDTIDKSGRSLAGIGLGVERLAMLMANVTDIAAVDPLAVQARE